MRSLIVIAISLLFVTSINAQQRPNEDKAHKHHHVKRKVAHRHVRPAKVRRVAHVKYRNLPPRGKVVTVLPQGYRVVKHGGVSYHLHKGIWYQPRGKKFVVVKAPHRVRVKILPVGYKRIVVRNRPYFFV